MCSVELLHPSRDCLWGFAQTAIFSGRACINVGVTGDATRLRHRKTPIFEGHLSFDSRKSHRFVAQNTATNVIGRQSVVAKSLQTPFYRAFPFPRWVLLAQIERAECRIAGYTLSTYAQSFPLELTD